jgi:hypothetical protein
MYIPRRKNNAVVTIGGWLKVSPDVRAKQNVTTVDPLYRPNRDGVTLKGPTDQSNIYIYLAGA